MDVLATVGRRPFQSPGLAFRLLPFGAAAAAGLVVPLGDPKLTFSWSSPFLYVGIGFALATAGLITWLNRSSRAPQWADVLPLIAFAVTLGCLREATNGKALPYLTVLSLMIWWMALYHPREQFIAGATFFCASLLYGLIDDGGGNTWVWLDNLQRAGQTIGIGFVVLYLIRHIRGQQTELANMAVTDPLTGAANFRSWNVTMRDEINWARRHHDTFSVGVMHLDDIRDINAKHGYAAGDTLLAACAQAWMDQLREHDILFRLHGVDFIVVMPQTDSDTARALLERVRRATPTPSCNVGAASWIPGETAAELMRRARAALATAREVGDDRVVIASESTPVPLDPRRIASLDG